ncbi:hypothetical protein [uncultured Psychrobacter sp.]|uniref:capsular polysaccharide export protein, LipB/KpsS family n=1 Tax=uncultured Psychrobacter sp. TaxID=259303 RepID=UPI002634B82B|nr:hypothetical protein [uncultured Psychrobacter sp.]
MKVFLGAKKDKFWSNIVEELKDNQIDVIYWIGEVISEDPVPENCFFHEVVDAYLLKNLYDIEIETFDITALDIKDYYCYLKILDRGDDLGGYSFSMRDRLFKEQLSYWYSILKHTKPDAIVFSNVPHLVYDYPMYLAAKHLGINTMNFNVLPFANWRYVANGIFSTRDRSNLVQITEDVNKIKKEFLVQAVEPYKNQNYSVPFYIKNQANFDNKNKNIARAQSLAKKAMVKSGLAEAPKITVRADWRHNFFSFSGEDNFASKLGYKVIKRRFINRLKDAYSRKSTSSEKIEELDNYVYVPLHYQPEATTAPQGGLYSDQIYMIEQLREWLPKDVAIVVKEHYSQFSGANSGYKGRYLTYWDKMSKIDNVYIAPMDYSQKDLILNSTTVAVITGTAGWEAIQYGKNCITFGEAWFNSHPNAFRFENLSNHVLKDISNTENLPQHTDSFLDYFCQSLVKTDFTNPSNNTAVPSYDNVTNAIVTCLNPSFLNNEK